MRRLLAMITLAAGPVLAACGGATSTSVDAVSSIPVSSSDSSSPVASPSESSSPDSSLPGSSSPVSSLVPPVPAALLIDSLPELTGPTVLWFWAPG